MFDWFFFMFKKFVSEGKLNVTGVGRVGKDAVVLQLLPQHLVLPLKQEYQ
jgi:hypothetical protein